MNREITFKGKNHETQFKRELANEVIQGNFEVIPSQNLESKSFNFLGSSIYRNSNSTEYFKLQSSSEYSSTHGSWKKVREIINQNPLEVRSHYFFQAQLGGNFGLAGRVILTLKFIKSEGELKVIINYKEAKLNRYVKTSVEFGLMYAIDTMQPFKKLEGEYEITVETIGFHEIDSSTITLAYTANMALRRAFDKETMHNAFLFESGRFNLYKKYPNHRAYSE